MAPATLALMAAIVWRNRQGLGPALLSLTLLARAAFGLPHFGYEQPPPDEWVRFCQKVKDVTPVDAVVITPPYTGGIQVVAQRAEVVNWKCNPLVEVELIEWKKRLNDLAGGRDLRCSGWPDCASALAQGYERLKAADFRQLAGKYRAQYVVTTTPEQPLHDFREVLRLYDFTLYQVPSPGELR